MDTMSLSRGVWGFKPLRFPETCKKYQDTTQAKTLLASHNISSKKEWKEWFGNLMVD